MEPIKKRSNPFATQNTPEPVVQQPKRVYDEDSFDDEPVVRTQKPRQHQQQVVVQTPQSEVRDKFTSTMDQKLRRKIKIYCAQHGKMFAEFVEDACREKLRREGAE